MFKLITQNSEKNHHIDGSFIFKKISRKFFDHHFNPLPMGKIYHWYMTYQYSVNCCVLLAPKEKKRKQGSQAENTNQRQCVIPCSSLQYKVLGHIFGNKTNEWYIRKIHP